MNNKVIKNYIYTALYKILVVIAPLLTTPYVSRVLHSDGVGIYSYTYTIAYAFSIVAALGINNYGQREIGYHQDDIVERSRIFFELLIFRIISTVLVLVVYLGFCLVYQEYGTYLIYQSFIILAVALDISWYFQGIEDFKTVVIRNVIVKVLTVILIFVFVQDENDVGVYILINSLSILVSNLFFFLGIRKNITTKGIKGLKVARHFRGAVEFFIPLIATELYSHLDKIMLGAMVTDKAESGYYEQARKVVQLVVSIVVSVNTVLMARISNLYAKGLKEEILKYYRYSYKFIVMLLAPICMGLILISDNLVVWFLGEGYEEVSVLLKLSSVLIIFMCVGNFVGVQYLAPTGQQNKMTIAYLISAATNLVLNAILIPILYSRGAMVASIAAECISCGIQVYYIKKSEFSFRMSEGIVKYIGAAAIMSVVIIVFHSLVTITGVWGTVVDVVLGAVVYFALLILFREELVYEFALKRLKARLTAKNQGGK